MEYNSITWLSSWSTRLTFFGWFLALLMLVTTIVGWHFSSRASKLKDVLAAESKKEHEQSISEANVKAAETEEKAAEANRGAAAANERAKKLEVEILSAKIKLQRLVLSQERRHINSENIGIFRQALAKTTRTEKIIILSPETAPDYIEPFLFAEDIYSFLKILKFAVEIERDNENRNFRRSGIPGFRVFYPQHLTSESPVMIDLVNAFISIGYRPRMLPSQYENITIVVGEKPKDLEPLID